MFEAVVVCTPVSTEYSTDYSVLVQRGWCMEYDSYRPCPSFYYYIRGWMVEYVDMGTYEGVFSVHCAVFYS